MKVLAAAAALFAGAEAAWNVPANAANIGTFSFGATCVSQNYCVTGMNANGEGAVVLVSQDGGDNWTNSPANVQGLMMILDTAAYGTNVLLSGPFGEMFSGDKGASFASSQGGIMSQGINVVAPNAGFAAAGQIGLNQTQGAAVSLNGGKGFVQYPASPLVTMARYVAAPSAQTIYVTAGQWPASNSVGGSVIKSVAGRGALRGSTDGSAYTLEVTKRVSVQLNAAKKSSSVKLAGPANGEKAGAAMAAASPLPDSIYAAQIVVSHDGGLTWQNSFGPMTNAFYFNGIACQDEGNCCAVAEGDTDSPAGAAAYIFCTNNGGASWTQAWKSTAAGASMMDITTGAAGEYIAVGGAMSDSVTGWFLRSGDSGATWQQQGTLDGSYGASVSCLGDVQVNGTTACWASVLTALQTTSIARSY